MTSITKLPYLVSLTSADSKSQRRSFFMPFCMMPKQKNAEFLKLNSACCKVFKSDDFSKRTPFRFSNVTNGQGNVARPLPIKINHPTKKRGVVSKILMTSSRELGTKWPICPFSKENCHQSSKRSKEHRHPILAIIFLRLRTIHCCTFFGFKTT